MALGAEFPVPDDRTAGSYQKVERKVGDFATAAAAVQVSLNADGTIRSAGIALSAAGACAVRVAAAEQLLAGVEARGTEADRAEVRAMSDEHADIDPLVMANAQGFVDVVEHPCEEHRNALDIRITGLREVLDEHLRHEESVVLPLVQRVMTTQEYLGVEKEIGKSYPVRDIPFIVGWALYGLPVEARDQMFALAGAPYRIVYALVRRWFARGEARVFRYCDGTGTR